MKEFIYLLENGLPVKILAKKRITPNTNFSKIGTGELQIRIWEWHIADKKMDWCMPGFPEVSPADIFKMKYVGEIKSQYFLKVRFREQTEVCCFKVFKNMPTRWEIEKACFPKVRFTEEQYDTVQRVFAGYKIKPTIYAGLPYQYRGLINCSECGCRITFEKKKAKYTYGHCTQKKGHHGAVYVNEDILTDQFKRTIEGITMPEDAYQFVRAELSKTTRDEVREREQAITVTEAEIKKYDNRIERVYEDYIDEKIPKDLYDKKFDQYTKAKQALVNTRKRFELVAKDRFSDMSHLLDLSRNAKKLFEKGTFEQKRQLIKMLGSNLELAGKELRWELKKPYDCIAFCNVSGNWLPLVDEIRTISSGLAQHLGASENEASLHRQEAR